MRSIRYANRRLSSKIKSSITFSNSAISLRTNRLLRLFAVTGGADYFVELRLFYRSSSSRDPAYLSLNDLERVQWTIADVKTGKKIADVKAKVRKPASGKTDASGVKEFAAAIADAMRKAIRKDIDKKSKR